MRNFKIIIFCFLLIGKIFAQNEVDSILNKIHQEKQDTVKLRMLIEMTEICELTDLTRYADPALELVNKLNSNGGGERTNLVRQK
jgi:hypothetical protein